MGDFFGLPLAEATVLPAQNYKLVIRPSAPGQRPPASMYGMASDHLFQVAGSQIAVQLLVAAFAAPPALVAALVPTPLRIAADAAGEEILHPVAVVIFVGLIRSTRLDILPPVSFLRFDAAPW